MHDSGTRAGPRILVYEFASGGGFGSDAPPASILAEGRAMRDALCHDLAALGIAVETAATDAAPAPAGIDYWRCRADECAADFLAAIQDRFDAVWLVAPESEGIAAALARRLESLNATLLGCGADAIELAARKSRCLAALAARGIATVPTWPLATAPFAEFPLWVVKPDVGCGCEDMRRLPAAVASTEIAGERIAQPWIEGRAMSLSLLVVDGSTELLSLNRQHIGIADDGTLSLAGIGRCRDIDPDIPDRLRTLGRRIASALPGLVGYVGVDFVLTPAGEAIVIEVNPRVTSAYVGLSAFLGRNVAGDIMATLVPHLIGPCIDLPPWSVGMSAARI